MSRNAFGPNLRRRRLQRGVTLDQIAAATKVGRELFDGLERNDFSNWPTGIYARAYVRQYAYAIGVDPDATVDEFCRWFEHGDRRAEKVVREQSEINNHVLAWKDDVPRGERRAGARVADQKPARKPADEGQSRLRLLTKLKRALGRT